MLRIQFLILPAHQRWQQRAEWELQRLEAAKREGIARRLALLKRALQAGSVPDVIHHQMELERLCQTVERMPALQRQVYQALGEPEPPPASTSEPKANQAFDLYWISSATLAEAYRFLTQCLPATGQEPEWMLAVTGIRNGRIRTLEHLIEVKLASQSAGHASFDLQDFTRIAVTLHEHGQALHAIFHSHRFAGPPHPSGIDDRLQRLLEEGGYPAIQAIFSEDGYIRFFARQRRFAIQVHGKGVICLDRARRLYRLVHFGTLPHPTLGEERGDAVRPLPACAGR
ncbi:MAG: hypothetical protein RML36_07885 [Anaerolineae bacterium]|nr:hypothetical protein [Anaerolineae bacterium]MDW8099383.1 hypothetical protein [Anaerolineae bacterium]